MFIFTIRKPKWTLKDSPNLESPQGVIRAWLTSERPENLFKTQVTESKSLTDGPNT